MSDVAVTCPPGSLATFVAGIVSQMGGDAEIAAEVSRHLVRSNLSGHDSHGVIRIPQYVMQADRGELRPGARPTILRDSGVTALVDARRGFGHFSTVWATDCAIERARRHGVAVVAVRHSSHIGRVGEYTEKTAAAGLIGIVTVGAGGPGVGGMVLHGGRGRFFGANPWSISVPGTTRSMIFDGSTSAVAEGKVRVARASRTPLAPDCIQDREGRPTRDPEDFYAGGALMPLGGAVAGHKGYGLAMASALVSALSMIDDPDPSMIGASSVQDSPDRTGRIAGVFIQVIDPGCFGDAGHYRALVEEHVAAAKRMPPASGRSEILLPGEPEVRTRAERSRDGITLPAATWAELETIARRFGVSFPPAGARA